MASELIERVALLEKQKAELVAALNHALTCAEKDGPASALASLNTVGRAALSSTGSPHGE